MHHPKPVSLRRAAQQTGYGCNRPLHRSHGTLRYLPPVGPCEFVLPPLPASRPPAPLLRRRLLMPFVLALLPRPVPFAAAAAALLAPQY